MKLEYLQKCAERQHIATIALAQQLVNLPAHKITTLPFVAKKGTRLYMYAPSCSKYDSDYVNPYIMNGSFAIELKMKYLHFLETGFKMKGGHRLRDLFDELSPKTRERIGGELRDIVHSSKLHKRIARYFNEEVKIQFRWDVEFLLQKANMAFERWRYIYENTDSTWFAGYTEIANSIDARIKEIESLSKTTSAEGVQNV